MQVVGGNQMEELFVLSEWIAIVIFSVFVLASLYYTVRLTTITRVWKSAWYWFMAGIATLGISREAFFVYMIRDTKCPETMADHIMFLYAPIVGAGCLMMALRNLFFMFHRYMDFDHLRREIKRMDRMSVKNKN